GTGLLVLDVASGKLRTLVEGPVTSAAFSVDGTRLAYALVEKGGAKVWVGSPSSAGRALTTIPGRKVDILGFGVDERTVFVVAYPDRQDDATYAATLFRLDSESGTVTPVLASDPAGKTVYADFRLVMMGGRQMVSFVHTSLELCTGPSALGLAQTDGTTARM